MRRAFPPLRFFSTTSRWVFTQQFPLSACFTGEVFIGGSGLLGGGVLTPKELLAGPLRGAAEAAQPGSPPPSEAYARNGCAEGVYTYCVGDAEVGRMLVARTASGDGLFQDSKGRVYAVDGGGVAVISGALVPPALRLVAQQGERKPFSLGHLVPLPAGAPVRVTARSGRLEFAPDGGQQPLLVLDTADSGDAEGEEGAEGEEAAMRDVLGEAAGASAPELLRALQARPSDAALAVSVCKVLIFRSGCANEVAGEERRVLARAVMEGGGMQLLRLVLEGHHRSEEVCTFGFALLYHFSEAGAKDFAAQVAPLLPTFAGALAAHPMGKALRRPLHALDAVLAYSSLAPAAAAAGLPALVAARLKSSASDEPATRAALMVLARMASPPGALAGTDAVPAIRQAIAAWPSLGSVGEALLKAIDLGNQIAATYGQKPPKGAGGGA